MPELEKKKGWFDRITPTVLGRAGPSKHSLKGADVYAGHPTPPPGDSKTMDCYDKAEKHTPRK